MAESKMFYYIPRCLLSEILCLTIAMKYRRIFSAGCNVRTCKISSVMSLRLPPNINQFGIKNVKS